MAMEFHAAPAKEDLAAHFKKYAGEGRKYMLLISEMLPDLGAAHNFIRDQAVDSQDEILPAIMSAQKNLVQGRADLTGIYDLSRDFAAQNPAAQLNTILHPYIKKVLDDRLAADTLKNAQDAWEAQPFLYRLFTSRPLKI